MLDTGRIAVKKREESKTLCPCVACIVVCGGEGIIM